MKYSIRIILLLSFFWASAQEIQIKELKGTISHDSLNVSGVHIINKTSGATTISDADGDFSVLIKIQDTLLFSAVQFKPHVIIVNNKIMQQDKITVYLEQRVNELAEVVIKPHDLSGNPAADMKNSNVKEPINFDDVGIPGFKGKREEKIVPIVPGIGTLTTVDIEAWYKHLSGYYKKLRLRRKWDKQNQAVVDLIEFYGVRFFMETYELTQEGVYEFVLACVEDEEEDVIENLKNGNHSLLLDTFARKFESIKERE